MEPLSVAQLTDLVTALGVSPGSAADAERIDRIRLLEQIKAACAAAQARETVAFRSSQLAAQDAAGVPARHRGTGIAAQVALARRQSPHQASRLVGLAQALVTEMPHTLAALERGQITEWRATVAVRETACLSRQDRATADARLAGRLAALGDREVAAAFKKVAYRLDPHAFVARARKADTERTVTLRPAPDLMTYLTALVPLKQGVAAFTALQQHADGQIAAGGGRTRGQLLADTLIERVTGQSIADDVPVEVQLVISDRTLAGQDDEPGHVPGHGPVPAPWARHLVHSSDAATWIRRLYTDGARLVAMESVRRVFPEGLRRFIVARDQTCRTPWCDAPIRHLDHTLPVQHGGRTTAANGQGLCAACNHAKEGHAWRTRPGPHGAGASVEITTPTGHDYTSRPPDPPRRPPPSAVEQHLAALVARQGAA